MTEVRLTQLYFDNEDVYRDIGCRHGCPEAPHPTAWPGHARLGMARCRQLGQPQQYEAASRLSGAWSRPLGSDMSEGSGHESRSMWPQDAVYPEHQ
jgi:hypothetical protein